MLRATGPRCTGIVWAKYERNKTIRQNLRVVKTRTTGIEELLRTYNVNPRNKLPKRRHYGPIWSINPKELRNVDKLGEIAEKFPLSPELKQDILKLQEWIPKQRAKPAPPKKISQRQARREAAIAAAALAAAGIAKPAAKADAKAAAKAAAKPAAAAGGAAAKPEAKKPEAPKAKK